MIAIINYCKKIREDQDGRRENESSLLSLGFLESPDRRGINLAVRTCKTNKAPAVRCQPALLCLS